MEHSKLYAQPGYTTGLINLKRISWSAIFAGVLVAIVVQMLLSLLGFGIGLGTIDAVEEKNPTAGLGIGSAIWYILSSLISLFAGSWVAGRLANAPRLFDGILHGVLTWCLVTLDAWLADWLKLLAPVLPQQLRALETRCKTS